MTTAKMRKKCTKCNRTFVVPVLEDTCPAHFIGKPPCQGELEVYAGDMEDSVQNIIAVIRQIHDLHRFKESELLEACLEDLDSWSQLNETPQQMGWVGQNGLP